MGALPKILIAIAAVLAGVSILYSLTLAFATPPSARERAAGTVRSYIAALERGDGRAACSLLSPSGQADAVARIRQSLPRVEIAANCAVALNKQMAVLYELGRIEPERADELAEGLVDSDSARVESTRASVSVNSDGWERWQLELTPDGWRISNSHIPDSDLTEQILALPSLETV